MVIMDVCEEEGQIHRLARRPMGRHDFLAQPDNTGSAINNEQVGACMHFQTRGIPPIFDCGWAWHSVATAHTPESYPELFIFHATSFDACSIGNVR
jgi:hypothetical protein